jgi:hypothetical protein
VGNRSWGFIGAAVAMLILSFVVAGVLPPKVIFFPMANRILFTCTLNFP